MISFFISPDCSKGPCVVRRKGLGVSGKNVFCDTGQGVELDGL